MQNPIVGKVLTQIETSKLSDKKIKEQLGQLKDREIEARLSNLRRSNNFNNNYNNNNKNFGGKPTGNLPGPPPPRSSLGAPDEPFDSFAGAIAPLPSPPKIAQSETPYPREILHRQIIILCLQKKLPLLIQIQIQGEILPADRLLV